jgi:hypothetical protein
MSSEIITVAGMEWPKAGKKMGAIIDSTGKRWGVWPDKMSLFQKFQAYDVTYESHEFKGQTYYTIKTVMPIDPIPGGNGMQAAVQNNSAPYAGPRSAPVPQAAIPNFDQQRRMDIFVCGSFNNIMANPTVNPFEVDHVKLINDLKRVWKVTLGPQPQETRPAGSMDKEMDDKIPW